MPPTTTPTDPIQVALLFEQLNHQAAENAVAYQLAKAEAESEAGTNPEFKNDRARSGYIKQATADEYRDAVLATAAAEGAWAMLIALRPGTHLPAGLTLLRRDLGTAIPIGEAAKECLDVATPVRESVQG